MRLKLKINKFWLFKSSGLLLLIRCTYGWTSDDTFWPLRAKKKTEKMNITKIYFLFTRDHRLLLVNQLNSCAFLSAVGDIIMFIKLGMLSSSVEKNVKMNSERVPLMIMWPDICCQPVVVRDPPPGMGMLATELHLNHVMHLVSR